jgi:cysteinyl-tRNA synthetase
MIERHLGETIDIHGGGLDLIFPHHENEIAQSRCAHEGKPLARFWVHNGFVDMGSEKMSKSLGNIITPAELLEQGHRGETLRLALLSAHYRQPLPWTSDLIAQSKSRLDRWYRAKRIARKRGETPVPKEIIGALEDDLNTPLALSSLDDLANRALDARVAATIAQRENRSADRRSKLREAAHYSRMLREGANLLGLLTIPSRYWHEGQRLPRSWSRYHKRARVETKDVEKLIFARSEAKKNRDFATADRIRDELKAEGIVLEDSASGTTWRRE